MSEDLVKAISEINEDEAESLVRAAIDKGEERVNNLHICCLDV